MNNSGILDSNNPFYPSLILGPSTIYQKAKSLEIINAAVEVMRKLENDEYTQYMKNYYIEGMKKNGEFWEYCDLITTLIASVNLIHPKNYLEIGVRRGRSICAVASSAPKVNIYAFDIWISEYAGNSNPGPEFIIRELKKFLYNKPVTFVNGNSHETLPHFFSEYPEIKFDLITIDGDHTEKGALLDLRDVLPHLNVGGIILFDDIIHPSHRYLEKVWKKAISEDGGIISFEFKELGYGLAIGVRETEKIRERTIIEKITRAFL